MTLKSITVLLIGIALGLSQPALAALPVYLPDIYAADEFGQSLRAEIKRELKSDEDVQIEITHAGEVDQIPAELSWIVDHLKRLETESSAQVNVTLSLVEDGEIKVKRTQGIDGQAYLIHYLPSNEGGAPPAQPHLLKKLGVRMRHALGLPNGISWIMYKLSFTDRTIHEHVVELTSAAVQAATLFAINFVILVQKNSEQPAAALHPEPASIIAASWKFITGYIERANNAFFAQGNNWDPVRKFTMNRRFALSGAYIHSIVIGMTVQLGANGLDGMTEAILAHTAWNSFLGLFAKAEPLLLIAKHQTKKSEVDDSDSQHHSKWRTIALNFVFATVYQATKAVHFYDLDIINIPTIFTVLGLGGLTYEVVKFFSKFHDVVESRDGYMSRGTYEWQRIKSRIARAVTKESKATCQSLLTVRRIPKGSP